MEAAHFLICCVLNQQVNVDSQFKFANWVVEIDGLVIFLNFFSLFFIFTFGGNHDGEW